MRILALRGENLASLAGPFEVRLDAGPLAQAGLFAITGPTGAGKSTLLDVMCLALFDQVPRLRGANRQAKVWTPGKDEHDHSATDTRGLLRRGTGHGRAEVEFLGIDGARWTATWAARRARNKPDGRLQNIEMSLIDATGQVVESKKTDVLKAIEARLGLGFEQFRRAALLAQGEFAAFLHADSAGRADVLERVTGTGIYANISRAVFERHKVEHERLKELTTRLSAVGVLPTERRQELVAQQAALSDQVSTLEQALDQARQALDWFQIRDRLTRDLQGASERLATLEQAWSDSSGERDLLARLVAAQAWQSTVEQADQAVLDVEQRTTRLHAAGDDVNKALAQQAEQHDRCAQAQDHLTKVRTTVEQAGPEVEQARALDATLAAAKAQADQRASELKQVDQDHNRAVAALEQARQALQAHLDGLARIQASLSADPEAAALAPRAHDVLHRLDRWLARRTELQTANTACAGLREQVSRGQQQAQELQRTRDAAVQTVAQADQALHAAEQALPPTSAEDLDAERAALDARRQALQQAWRALESLERASQDLHTTRQQQTELAGLLDACSAALTQARAERPVAQALDTEARATLDRLQASRALESRRHELIDGDPCPLCGATEHPWSQGGAPDDSLIAGQRARVAEVAARLQAVVSTEHAESNKHRDLLAQQQRLSSVAASQGQAVSVAERAWGALYRERPDLPETPERSALEQLEASIAQAAADLDGRRAAFKVATDAVRAAELRQKQAQQARTQAEGAQREAEQALHAQQADLGALEARLASLQAALTDLRSDLDRDLQTAPGWLRSLDQDPDGTRERLQAALVAAADHLAARDRLQDQTPALSEAAVRAEVAEQTARTDLQAATRAHHAAAQVVSEHSAARSALLDGRSTHEVVTQHQRDLDHAQESVTQARQALSQAQVGHSAATARLHEQQHGLAQAQAQREERQHALEQACQQLEIDVAELRGRLAQAQDIPVLTSRIDAQRSQRLLQQGRLHSTQQSLASHERDAPPVEREALQGLHTEYEAQRQDLYRQRAEVDAELLADRKAGELAQRLNVERDAQAAVYATWAALQDVIGHSEGRTFQRFAQGVTLELLLAHANAHLGQLAPRYLLQRVPDSELDLQVLDRDLGDEIRGVHTLSGGESFLASLALALGLASLAASETPVESLFIDEGFGTLDRDTLDVALAALDALQASGRQVGVISHVAGLAERIGVQVQVVPRGAGRSSVRVV